jgi:predicted transcriptional regulator
VNTEKVNPHLTAKIVQSYVRHHTLGSDQLADLIASVHRTLGQLGQEVQPAEAPTPAVSIRQSVRHDYVVCLDCGYRGKTLRRHISSRHGLTGDEYRQRWGLRSSHPLTAPAYSEHRSTLAKELGLGRKSTPAVAPVLATAEPAAAKIDEKIETSPKRTRTRRPRSKSDVNEAAAELKARQRRPRSRLARHNLSHLRHPPTDA